ncbi:TonB-dependent receptor [Olivibacter sp. SA151]|uniref:TonB-dependent siderophore receptor n=1 Tax=Olivibacter jilunii TaxID=985016 RepID=UPI003F14370A
MKLKLFITVALVGVCRLSPAQSINAIGGVIKSIEGKALPGITIGIPLIKIYTVSDSAGMFNLTKLPLGRHELRITGIGYRDYRKMIDLNDSNTSVDVEVYLEPVQQALQEVLVEGRKERSYVNRNSFIGTKVETALIDVPQTISSVTKELIEDKQAFIITDVVSDLAGVNQYSSYDDLTIRGFRSGYGSGFRLVNGLRSGYGYGTSFFRVPMTINLESIEVLKGPGAALFGDISPGGSVNMVTKKPLEESRHAITIGAGSFNTVRTMLDFTGALEKEKKLLYRLNIGQEHTNTFRDVNHRKSMMLAPTFTFRPTEQTTINAEVVYGSYDGYLDRGISLKGNDLYALPRSFTLSQPSDYFRVNDLSINASLNHKITSNLSLNLAYMKFLYSEELSEHRTLNTYADAANTIMNLRYMEKKTREYTDNVSAYFSFSGNTGALKHHLVGGMDYIRYETDKRGHQWEARSQEINGEIVPLTIDLNNPIYELRNTANYIRLPLAPFFVDYLNSSYRTTGIYIQNQINAGKRLKLLMGLRYEMFNDSRPFDVAIEKIRQNAWLPRFGLTYSILDQVNYFASYSQGFIPVNPQFVRNPENYGRETPFKKENSFQIENGIKGSLLNRRVFAALSFYHIERRNMLVNTGVLNDLGNPIYRQNGRVKSQGAELEFKGNITDNIQLSGNYAFNHTRILETEIRMEQGMLAANAPKHTAGWWGKYVFNRGILKGIGVGIGGQLISERRMENPTTNIHTGEQEWGFWPSYVIANTALYYQIGNFRLATNINNIFNKYYYVGGFDYTRAFPGTPRNAMVSLGYTF